MAPNVLHQVVSVGEHGFIATLMNPPNAEKSSWAYYAILGTNLGMVPVLAVLIANQLQV